MSYYGRRNGAVLELGSFAGGITFELAEVYPDLNLTIADEESAYVEHLRCELVDRNLLGRVRLLETKLDRLAFPDHSFDFIILRGAFFFIMTRPGILKEIHRVLKAEAVAFIGGGYGQGVPPGVIDEIAEESRLLNDRLGRRRVSIGELRALLGSVGLEKQTHIVEEGGVWIVLRKQGCFNAAPGMVFMPFWGMGYNGLPTE